MSYRDQLKDPRWQRVRLAVMERAGFMCECCQERPEGESLHVHHRGYERGRMAWEYPMEALACLCAVCHEEMERVELELLRAFEIREIPNISEFAGTAGIFSQAFGLKRVSEIISEGFAPDARLLEK